MSVLVLITRVIHWSTLRFAVAPNLVLYEQYLGKWEKLVRIEQYHIIFVEKSHYLKRLGRKAFLEWLFSWS